VLDLRDLSVRRPIRIAHRGGVVGPGAPENSLAAIERAAARGYDMVELDVVASREGEPFLFHDWGDHLGRTCGVDARIGDLSAQDLSRITYRASDQPIAPLDDALARCATLGLGIMLDVKTHPAPEPWVARIAALLDAHGFGPGSSLLLQREWPGMAPLEARTTTRPTQDQERRARAREPIDLRGRYWFGLPEELPDEAVTSFQSCGALVIPAINRFRYPEHADRELARQDVTRLLAAGVDGFQVDSLYGDLLPDRAPYEGSDFYCDEVFSGRTPVEKVAETENVLAFHHTRPFYPVHVVVVPKRHVASLVTLTPEDEPLLSELLAVIRRIAAHVTETHGAARVITNLGAYQDSKHLHWHVVSGAPLR
jgi:histidine triad (HIT) family protein